MIRSKKLRDSANGEECTLNIAGVCNYDSTTTVLAHLPDASKGTGLKADDICSCFACSDCHSCVDGRLDPSVKGGHPDEWYDNKEFYMRRAMVRTLRRWIELGLVVVK